MKYFEVEAKCGHVGINRCILITFACIARDGKEAAGKARQFPRVKHDHKDAIRNVREISFEEFVKLRCENDADPFLHCKNPQEQRKIPGFEALIIPDTVEMRMSKKRSPLRRVRTAFREAEQMDEMRRFMKEGEPA